MPKEDTAWDINPKDMKRAIAKGKYENDCLACKITGSLAFIGLGVYSYVSGVNNLKKQEKVILKSKSPYKMGSRRLGIATISVTLVGMGIWRALH
ncbi:hypothetical protein PAAG_06963 [Paracoccidioides lutzii Pb01]|uniref:Distal membrane-arm assembly complex protein 1-like domain-containing protein n=1 Tax=Paracoccidioides lutzii (strain ATCC MYA-826 / Pb01) TaxID=502779 RepID=C1H8G7_PARBA|nr:hypothetical protein PAAG_06963 [Paracoccidioides lutzii Pb01]EEH36545.1 hypothetical protein PAAG_06963 [Paracoccidioides lutzii Pb01]